MADEDIDIKVSLRDEASKPAERVADKIERIDRTALKASTSVKLLEQRVKEEARAALAAAAANEKNAAAQKKVGDSADEAGKKSAKGSKGFDKMKKSMSGAGKSAGALMQILKFGVMGGTILDGIGQLSGLIGAIGAAAISATAGLAPLSGLLVAYPGYMAAIGQGVLTTKLAFSGMGDALKEMTADKVDPEKLAKSLKGVTKEGRSLLKYIVSLKDDWKSLKKEAQSGMMPGLESALRRMVKVGFPTFRKGIVETSKAMGSAAKGFSFTFGTPSNMAAMGRIFKNNGNILREMGRIAGHAFGILIKVLDAARPMMLAMTKDVGDFFARMNNGMDAKKVGALSRFFSSSYRLLKRIIPVVVDFGKGLINIFKASVPMSEHLGKGIEKIATKFREWTESKAGIAKMRTFWMKMQPIFDETVKIVWDLVKALGDLSMDPSLITNLKLLRTEFLPALVNLTKQAQGKFIPAIITIVTELGKIAGGGNIFGPISVGLEAVAAVLGPITDFFTGLPGEAQSAIISLGLFAAAGRDIGPKMSEGFGKIRAGFSSIKGEAPGVGTAIKNAFHDAGGGIGGVSNAIGVAGGKGLRGVMGGFSSFLGGPWGVAFTIAGAALGTWLAKRAEAKQQVTDFTTAIENDTGAISKNTEAAVLNAMQKDGTLKAFRDQGADLKLVRDAALGVPGAYAALRGSLTKTVTAYDITGGKIDWTTGKMEKHTRKVDAVSAENEKLLGKIGGVNIALGQATDAYNLTAEAAGKATVKSLTGADALSAAGKAANQTTTEVSQLNGMYVKTPAAKKTQVSAPGAKTAITEMSNFQKTIFNTPNSKPVTVSVNGIDTSIAQIQNLQRAIDSLKGKEVGVRYVQSGNVNGGKNTGGGKTADADGGWVGPGRVSYVNERGPEAFWDRATGALEMLGTGTPWETVAYDRPGYVVPHEVLTGKQSGANIPSQVMDAVKRSVPSAAPSASAAEGGLPPVTVKVGSVRDDADIFKIERAVQTGIRKAQQEAKERK